MFRVLLIEDAQEIGDLISIGLRPHPVTHVYSLSEAEEALKTSQFEILIIDVSLPDGSGFDLCARLCQEALYQNIPKMILTASDQLADKVYGFSCGADDYLTKPFHMQELRARVERLLRRSSSAVPAQQRISDFVFDSEFQKYIAHLRKKLGAHMEVIVSIYGQGYSFNSQISKSEAA